MKHAQDHTNGTHSRRGPASSPMLDKKTVSRLAREVAGEIKRSRKKARKASGSNGHAPQPHYGDGSHYDSGVRYPVTDPTPPINDGGKVKMDLFSKTDTQLVNYTYAHIEDMTGNEIFPAPQPSAVDFKALADAFADAVTAKLNADNAARDATATRDAARLALTQAFSSVRGPYVQSASNGNTEAILSSGLQVRNPRTPTGDLPPPQNLAANVNGTPGVVYLTWLAVAKARGYNIQYSPADTIERNWQPLATVNKAKFTATGLVSGKNYAFQVASNGGASGTSFWSPEVVRMAS